MGENARKPFLLEICMKVGVMLLPSYVLPSGMRVAKGAEEGQEAAESIRLKAYMLYSLGGVEKMSDCLGR